MREKQAAASSAANIGAMPISGGTAMKIIVAALVGMLTLATSPSFAADPAREEANKKTVLEFYEQGLNRKDFDAAAKFIGPRYVQHNPTGRMAPKASRLSWVSCAINFRIPTARSSAHSPKAIT